jgi:MFS family permease
MFNRFSIHPTDDPQEISHQQRSNFFHLYFDMSWFGVLNASAMGFVAVYVTRLGASSFQLGLLNALPSLVALVMALPLGRWMTHKPIRPVVLGSAVLYRAFYLLWVIFPLWVTQPQLRIDFLLVSTFLMSFPGTALSIAFNNLFAATVTGQFRPHVVGVRQALFAVFSVLTALLCGFLLNQLPFDSGYFWVFFLGLFGAVASTVHLYFIHPAEEISPTRSPVQLLRDWAQPGLLQPWNGIRRGLAIRSFTRGVTLRSILNPSILRGEFGVLLGMIFAFHFAQFMGGPLFPLWTVNELRLTDLTISYANGLFFTALAFASLWLAPISRRLGNAGAFAVGAVSMAVYPFLLSIATGAGMVLFANVVAGVSWAITGGALGNFVLERIPNENRATHLAWQNIALHGAILFSSLFAPWLAEQFGLKIALEVTALARFFSGVLVLLLVWKEGNRRKTKDEV